MASRQPQTLSQSEIWSRNCHSHNGKEGRKTTHSQFQKHRVYLRRGIRRAHQPEETHGSDPSSSRSRSGNRTGFYRVSQEIPNKTRTVPDVQQEEPDRHAGRVFSLKQWSEQLWKFAGGARDYVGQS